MEADELKADIDSRVNEVGMQAVSDLVKTIKGKEQEIDELQKEID